MLVFKHKFGLRKMLSSVLNKLKNNENVSNKICKKVSLALVNKDLIPKDWTKKTVMEVPVNLTGKSPMLAILVNDQPTSCILDTGSTFTLIPFPLWKKLNINPNKLNTSVLYNINSASHRNANAVLGSIELVLAIRNEQGDDQLLKQKCLILRPELKLQIVLLGGDFLLKNSAGINYDDSTGLTSIKINNKL